MSINEKPSEEQIQVMQAIFDLCEAMTESITIQQIQQIIRIAVNPDGFSALQLKVAMVAAAVRGIDNDYDMPDEEPDPDESAESQFESQFEAAMESPSYDQPK